MKQLRNILTGVLLVWGLLLSASVQADSIPVAQNGLAAELDSIAQRDDVTSAEQEKNTVNVKDRIRAYWRFVRMAYYSFWGNACYHSVACHCI